MARNPGKTNSALKLFDVIIRQKESSRLFEPPCTVYTAFSLHWQQLRRIYLRLLEQNTRESWHASFVHGLKLVINYPTILTRHHRSPFIHSQAYAKPIVHIHDNSISNWQYNSETKCTDDTAWWQELDRPHSLMTVSQIATVTKGSDPHEDIPPKYAAGFHWVNPPRTPRPEPKRNPIVVYWLATHKLS